MSNLSNADLDAVYYQHHSQPQYERAQELLKSLVLNENASVLDVGCGHGNIIADISRVASNGRSIGIDASQNMIDLAKEMFPSSKFQNLEFQAVKAEEMQFPESHFDAIVCFSCLLWVREPKKALDLMCKFLKPGGVLLILTYLKESAYINFLEKTLEEFPTYTHLSAARTMLTANEYENILKSHGLELDQFQSEWRFSKYKDAEALKSYLQGWLNCYVPLPEPLHEPFLRKAVINSFAENKSVIKHEIALPYRLLAIKAHKPLR